MPVKFNVNRAIKLFFEYGGKTDFPKSLRQVLTFMQNDENVNSKINQKMNQKWIKNESEAEAWGSKINENERKPKEIIPKGGLGKFGRV